MCLFLQLCFHVTPFPLTVLFIYWTIYSLQHCLFLCFESAYAIFFHSCNTLRITTTFSEVSEKKSIGKTGTWKVISVCWSGLQPVTDVLSAAEKKLIAKQRGI